MTEKHYVITLAENLVIKSAEGTINRNSNGSQWLDVTLDKWNLNEGEALYVVFECYDDDYELTTRVGPLYLGYNSSLKRYVTLMPPEVVSMAGQWKYSIELRFDIEDDTSGKTTMTVTTVTDSNGEVVSTKVTGKSLDGDIVYRSITSSIETLTVMDSTVKPTTGNIIKETELISAAQTIEHNSNTALDAAGIAMERAAEAENQADRAAENAKLSQAAAEEAKAAVKEISSKAIVIWGFNEAVDISDLEWEVK